MCPKGQKKQEKAYKTNKNVKKWCKSVKKV